MSTLHSPAMLRPVHRERGFTLVELMVTIAIAMFLLGGLATIVQNTKTTYANQQALAQLQDQQRFAMSVVTSVIEMGGYYDNPTGDTVISALPPVAPNFGSGQAFFGTGNASGAAPDSIYVRFRTAQSDGIINCSGGQNTAFNPDHVYTNQFSIVAGQGLVCSLDGAANVPLVAGVTNLQLYYGVKRLLPFSDYNVDTYVSAADMQGSDWDQVSAVRVILTFTNPLAGQSTRTTAQPATIQLERVIQVMARAGDHT
jgi:type IV pilus assembly protein PilW